MAAAAANLTQVSVKVGDEISSIHLFENTHLFLQDVSEKLRWMSRYFWTHRFSVE